MSSTVAYYEENADQYFQTTVDVDMSPMYGPFLREVPAGGLILDAGCGSGRDTKAFLERGYRVVAIDASPHMAKLATAFTRQQCDVLAFQDMAFKERFDGIWACASLLHVPKRELPDVLHRFSDALRLDGVFYISLKQGEGERLAADGRCFNYYTAESFRDLLSGFPSLREIRIWTTEAIRASQHPGPWLNVLLSKTA